MFLWDVMDYFFDYNEYFIRKLFYEMKSFERKYFRKYMRSFVYLLVGILNYIVSEVL